MMPDREHRSQERAMLLTAPRRGWSLGVERERRSRRLDRGVLMALHVIVGKGPVGSTTAQELVSRGHEVRVLSRSGGQSTATVEHRQVDATDAGGLAEAGRGAAALYNAVNPAYSRWATDWPPVAAALLTAAERTGAVLVTMGNLYGYGRPTGVMTPDSPLAATDTKGRVRN